MSGATIGPRADSEYAVDPVGVATMSPSAAYVVQNVVVDGHVQPHRVAHRRLFEDRLVQRQRVSSARFHEHVEHHPFFDVVVAGEESLERRLHVGWLDVREVAELPDS